MATARAHNLLRNSDPMIDPNDYEASVARATNYFSVKYDNKDRREWVKTHFPKVKFGNHHDHEFKTLGALCRLLDNGNELSEKHHSSLESEFQRLVKPADAVNVVEVESAPKATIQEKMDEKVNSFLGEFAGLVDDYIVNKHVPKVDVLINSMGIRGPMVSKVLARIKHPMQELQEALEGTDKQLVEGYSHLKKVELKRLLGIYESLVAALGQAKVLTTRKPRKIKAKPASVIVKNVAFCLEDKELGLKSIPPAQAVGMSEIWTFNVKYRKLAQFKAMDGMTLTFKGSTLKNFDVEKSTIKTIRKPEELSKLVGQGTRAWSAFFKLLTTKPGILTGQFGEHTLILAVMK